MRGGDVRCDVCGVWWYATVRCVMVTWRWAVGGGYLTNVTFDTSATHLGLHHVELHVLEHLALAVGEVSAVARLGDAFLDRLKDLGCARCHGTGRRRSTSKVCVCECVGVCGNWQAETQA